MANKKAAVKPVSTTGFLTALALLSAVSVGLLSFRILSSDSMRYVFLFWNLVLAAIPLALAWWLLIRVRKYGWLKWQQIGLSFLWLIFLPNSFYLITDLIHLRPNFEADLLFDIVLLMSFIVTGLILGFVGVYMLHRELDARLTRPLYGYGIIGVVLLAVSFAVCLGRYTRWNTWDILLQPAGLLFDVSDRVINPSSHLQTYQTTFILFLLLFATYAVIYEGARLLRAK